MQKDYKQLTDKELMARYKQLKTKSKQLHNLQYAKKIQLNSAYGALANKWFRWYSEKQAEAVTSSGQLTIMWIEKETNKWFNKIMQTSDEDYVIACDTDSMYLSMERMVSTMIEKGLVNENDTEAIVSVLDALCQKKIEPFLNKKFDELGKYVNAFKQKMHMKRECIADRAIWTAKKRYIMNVWDEEGVRHKIPETKVTGIESVRSSTPDACRKNIKKALEIILNGTNDDLIEFIENFRKEFYAMPFEDVAFPRGLHNLSQYKSKKTIYTKGTPIHVRGALIYNEMLKEYNLENMYEPIYEGDKIKFCYMILPNPAKENIFSVPNILPKQFGLDIFIDYDTQFKKAFLDPIRHITDIIGWEVEPQPIVETAKDTDEDFCYVE